MSVAKRPGLFDLLSRASACITKQVATRTSYLIDNRPPRDVDEESVVSSKKTVKKTLADLLNRVRTQPENIALPPSKKANLGPMIAARPRKDCAIFYSHQVLSVGRVVVMESDGSIEPWTEETTRPILGVVEHSCDLENNLVLFGIASSSPQEHLELGMRVFVGPDGIPTTDPTTKGPRIGVAISKDFFSFVPGSN